VRQLIAESLLLSAAGGALGCAVASAGLSGLTAVLGPPPGAPGVGRLSLDASSIAIALALVIVVSLAFGVGPALSTTRRDPMTAIASSASGVGTSPRGHRRRALLVAAQVAMAAVLLVGAALVGASFVRLAGRPLGLEPRGLLSVDYTIAPIDYAQAITPDRGRPTFRIDRPPGEMHARLLAAIATVPGVQAAGAMSYLPVNSLVLPTLLVHPGRQPAAGAPEAGIDAAHFLVTPGLFQTLGTPVVAGRGIDERDRAGAAWVAVVNEALAQRLWTNGEALSRQVVLDEGPDPQPREIVGVVADVPTRLGQPDVQPVVYTSALQQPAVYSGRHIGQFGQMTFFLRHTGDDTAVLAAARRRAATVDPHRPLYDVGHFGRALGARMTETRNYVVLLGAFAAAALLLAALGVYGVLASAVSQRTREIGIRKTLGAGTASVVTMIGRHAAGMVGAGLLAGLGGSLALTRLLTSQLWGTSPTDPAAFIGVALLIVAVSIAACIVPTRRALGVDPAVTLRSD
jgi:putative ABC transport system permease protein